MESKSRLENVFGGDHFQPSIGDSVVGLIMGFHVILIGI